MPQSSDFPDGRPARTAPPRPAVPLPRPAPPAAGDPDPAAAPSARSVLPPAAASHWPEPGARRAAARHAARTPG
jgi:hypothetical protein